MAIKKVRALNYNASYEFAPPQEYTLVNTDHITHAQRCEARGCGPFVRVRFIDGEELVIVGTIDDLLPD